MKLRTSALLLACALAACTPEYDARYGAVRSDLSDQIESGKLQGDALAMALLKRGYTLQLDKLFDRALADYDAAVAAAPELALAYATRAQLLADQGRADAAMADADRAVELAPGDVDNRLLRGRLRAAKGDTAGAIADSDEIVTRLPQEYRGYVSRGLALAATGQEDRALADFDRAVALVPKTIKSAGYRECVRFQAQTTPNCRTVDVEMSGDVLLGPVYEARGRIYYARGDYKRAAPDLEHTGFDGELPVMSALAHFAAGNCKAGHYKLHLYDDFKGVDPDSVIAAHRDFIGKTPCAADVLSE